MTNITKSALISRINRKLVHNDEVLKVTRGERLRLDVGDYYILDWRIYGIAAKHVDLEELGRELGVLQAHERLQEATS